jgi:hypothetical protein
MINRSAPTNFRLNLRMSSIAGFITICLMMSCVGTALMYFGLRLAPSWNISYLPWLCAVVALEAILSRNITRSRTGREKWIYMASELIFIAVAIKILIYLFNGFNRLFIELPAWEQDLGLFFTVDYVFVLVSVMIIWLVTGVIASDIESLHDQENDWGNENIGFLEKNRMETRQSLTEIVLSLGIGVVFLTALTRVSLPVQLNIDLAPVQAPIMNAVAYFLLALALASMSQFALLHSRWLWQHIPVNPKIAWRWIFYTFLFFVFIAALAAILPTHYSRSLLYTLQIVFTFIVQVVLFIIAFIIFLVGWLLSGCTKSNSPEAPAAPPFVSNFPITPNEIPPTPIPWLEFVRSIAFWLVFTGIIIYAVRTYLLQNKILLASIKEIPFISWLLRGLITIWDWLRGVNQQFIMAVSAQLARFQVRPGLEQILSSSIFGGFQKLNPRQKIIFYYLALIKRGGQYGLTRKPSQTPLQYEHILENTLPEVREEIDTLTDSFIEARYSAHEISGEHANHVQQFWKRVMTTLRGLR